MWSVIICLTIIFTIKILHGWRRSSKFPPGPRGLPIVGNIFDMKRLVNETKFYSHAWCRLADIYGPIVGLKLGMAEPLIIVSGKDAVVEMLSRPEFDGRPNGFSYRHRTGGVRRGIIFTDGGIWRDQRRFALKTLKEFGFGKVTMEDIILNDAVSLTNIVESLAKSGPITNLYNITSIAVLNSLWTLVAGSRLDLSKDNSKLMEIISVFNDITRNSNVTGGLLTHLPFLRHIIPGLSGFTLLNQRLTRLSQFFKNEIARHKQTRMHGEFRDFIDAYLEEMDTEYDVPEISKYLDFINVMAYDFHGQWERQVGHNSPLYPLESATGYQKKLTVNYSAREWVKQGAPKEKLMIGMPTYGRSFTLVDKDKFDIGAPASGGGVAGNFTNESGFLSYYEVCSFLNEDNTTLVWDSEQQVPFAYRDDQWVGFDDERSLINKMTWLKEEGFGGVMIWSVDMDDFKGSCGTGRYPLIKAMKRELQSYKVKLEYDGPYESNLRSGKYTTRDPNEVLCDEEDNHISYHADKNDCTMYYMCEGERKHHMPCPVNLVFNPNENVCDWPENVEGCLQHTQAPPV